MSNGRFIELVAEDGHRFAAWESAPAGEARGAVVIAPEIFGVNSHIRAVADRYAADGYLAIAPALFDRVQRDYDAGYSPAEVEAGVALMQRVSIDAALTDVKACIAHGRRAGAVAIVGFCWGGTVAWVAAARLAGLACAVPYYGGGIPDFAAEQPECPVMFHFAEQDKRPTEAQAREIAAAHPSAIAHFYPAGHGFNCDQRGSYHAESSRLARERTLEFLARHLG
jgi:carboxymethylenebutenolidase